MANRLHNLTITEVSLVDRPANSEVDPRTGHKTPRATVALYKRDNTSTKETKVMAQLTLKQILKSDNLTFSRESIAAAVRAKAVKVATKRGISIEKAEARVWRKNPAAHFAYENAPTPILKREPRTAQITQAEATLEERARRRMKRTGQSYPLACRHELEEDPGLYEKYEKEMAAGATFETPEYVNGSNGDEPDEDGDGDANSMYARRPQSTADNDMTDQERKNKNKIRR